MNECELSRSLQKLLPIVLSLSLLAPVAVPADRATQPKPEQPQALTAPAEPAQTTPQSLSQDELKELSQRAEEPGEEVAGGALSNEHLTYAIIALAAAVIVLIAK